MGILNVTPDSFYDGNHWWGEAAIEHFSALIAEGAAIIDVGGESSRPGACGVSAREQIARIAPVLEHAARTARDVLVTVDTCDPVVAEFALRHGVHAINDVSCLANPLLASLTSRYRAGLIIMHARGPMRDMPGYSAIPESSYNDVVLEVSQEWGSARRRASAAGMPPEDIVFDPGLGFWKSARHSLELLGRLEEFHALQVPIMIGASRKSFLTLAEPGPPDTRLGASIAACLASASKGAHIVRVHDVKATRQALLLQRMLTDTCQRTASVTPVMVEAC